MHQKKLPLSKDALEALREEYGTPFHLYAEQDIRENVRRFQQAFAWAPSFYEYFAVKALPNPFIMKILKEEGCGADCSSMAELILSEKIGLSGSQICFTSNDTPAEEFRKAFELDAIINLDDITHLEYLKKNVGLPSVISFRYNPGPMRGGGNDIIGQPEQAKYGLTKAQMFEGFKAAQQMGVKRFGLHTMIVSNELNVGYLVGTATMMFELAREIYDELGIVPEFINFGGGIGIPYRPDQCAVNLEELGEGIRAEYERLLLPYGMDNVRLCFESGRMITGPYGYLVSTAIHRKDTYKHYIGLDSCMADLMRPALYGSYHHITIPGKEDAPLDHLYDVTGSLCENNDKFAVDRALPKIDIGDMVVMHDTGAHGYAMGFNYNGKLRSKELLLKPDGSVQLIRRAETYDDLFATLDFSKL